MTRLIWLGAGLVLGIAIARNAPAMSTASASGVVIGLLGLAVVTWMAGRREKNSAVAVAVASARAEAEANAAAIAQAAVHLHMAEQAGDIQLGYTGSSTPTLTATPEVLAITVEDTASDIELAELVEHATSDSEPATATDSPEHAGGPAG